MAASTPMRIDDATLLDALQRRASQGPDDPVRAKLILYLDGPLGIGRVPLGILDREEEADLPEDTRKQYLDFLQDILHKGYLDILEKEITKAFVYSYQEQAEALFQNYLDHAEAFVNKTKVKDRNTREELQPDEGFLKSIEEQLAIIGSAAEGFRQEVIAYLWAASRRSERISYRTR